MYSAWAWGSRCFPLGLDLVSWYLWLLSAPGLPYVLLRCEKPWELQNSWDLGGGGQLMSPGPDLWTFDQWDKGAWDAPTRWSYQLLLLFSGGLLSNAYFNICLLSFSISFPFSSFLFSYVPVHSPQKLLLQALFSGVPGLEQRRHFHK